MNQLIKILALSSLALCTSNAYATSGSLDAFNCHTDTRINHYHCHQSAIKPAPKTGYRNDGGKAIVEAFQAYADKVERDEIRGNSRGGKRQRTGDNFKAGKAQRVSDTEQARKDEWFKSRMAELKAEQNNK
ncbi:hypothetical protein CXF85_19825 [Colwellia sp. 75C3]|uniref:hypothetical protein n=1 Tax=Colwellia sp. 75C3 TaxID=888425 RepID=UPI000C3376CF|nr:hypothetical protein [Colwellia sp. 75C3]PKG81014.1 hypothetical protein CXF85_19825 [Colwellia sp. 75C3]